MSTGWLVRVVLIMIPAVASAQPSPIQFEEALKAAEANMSSDGAAYNKEFGERSAKHLGSALTSCLGGPVSSPLSLQILLRVELDGKVSSALARPDGTVAACVRDKLKRAKYPKPSSSGHWRAVAVGLNP